MDDFLTPADIERLAKEANLPIGELCKRANIAASTWSRWKKGETVPRLDVARRLRDAAQAAVEAV